MTTSKAAKKTYIITNFKRILNDTDNKDCTIKVQFRKGYAQTNFLNISEEQLLKIKKILIKG